VTDWIADALAELAARELLRSERVLGQEEGEPPDGRTVAIDGRRYLCFASNNYLGLAGDERVRRAAAEAALRFGAGSGASRLITGTLSIHKRLERELAEFKGAEDAVLFVTGYQAGMGTVAALAGKGDAVILDKLSHACLVDGARLSGARLRVYPHLDTARLAALLERERTARRRLVVTESLFSMDGDLAPLRDICEIAFRSGAMVLVDEAHATGTTGPAGRGLVAELGLASDDLVQMGTLSKALGSAGGFVAGTRRLCDYLRNSARSYIFTTAPPPAAVGAALEALRILRAEPWLVERLRRNVERLSGACPGLGAKTPIVPVIVGESRLALAAQEALRERGIWTSAVRPPTVPRGGSRLRISISAAHTEQDIDVLAAALGELGLDRARPAAQEAPE